MKSRRPRVESSDRNLESDAAGSGQLAKVRLVVVGSAVAVDLEEVVSIGPCELEGGARNQAAGLDGSVETEQDAVLIRIGRGLLPISDGSSLAIRIQTQQRD